MLYTIYRPCTSNVVSTSFLRMSFLRHWPHVFSMWAGRLGSGCKLEVLRAITRRHGLRPFCLNLLLPELETTSRVFVAQRVIQLIPVVGGLFASPLTIGTTYKQLDHALSLLERAALDVYAYMDERTRLM